MIDKKPSFISCKFCGGEANFSSTNGRYECLNHKNVLVGLKHNMVDWHCYETYRNDQRYLFSLSWKKPSLFKGSTMDIEGTVININDFICNLPIEAIDLTPEEFKDKLDIWLTFI